MRLLLVLLLLAGTAVAAPPRLVAYRGTNYTIDLPKGWSVKVDEAAGVLGAQQNPKNKSSPALMIMTKVGVAGVSAETITSAILQQLAGNNIQLVSDEEIDNGRSVIADGKLDGVLVRVGLVVLVANGGAVVAALVAPKAKFDAVGGAPLVMSVLRSFRFTTATAPKAEAASTSAIAEGVYVGTSQRTVTGRHGATMELALVWYTFGPGWFEWRWGPPQGLEIQRTENALPYEASGNTFRFTSRGTPYTRKLTRLGKDRLKLDDIELTKVDLRYNGLTLNGTYHADSIARVTNPTATTTQGATTVSSAQAMVLRKDGTVESERTTTADTGGRGGVAEVRRKGRYSIGKNLITFKWDDGTSETRTFSLWGSADHLLIEKTLYSRKR